MRTEARAAVVYISVSVVIELFVQHFSAFRCCDEITGSFVLYPEVFASPRYLLHDLSGFIREHLSKLFSVSDQLIARVCQLMIEDIQHLLVISAAVVKTAPAALTRSHSFKISEDRAVTADIVQADIVRPCKCLLLDIEVFLEFV